MKVHLIGAGKMGLPMARHLLAGGHAVTVEDTQEERLAAARAAGLEVARGASAAAGADVVFSSLPNDRALLAVGEQVARSARPGAIYVDTSTVSQEASAQVAQACEASGVRYLRITVSGNNHMAEAAQLTVMASGPRPAYDEVLPLLRLLGPTHFWLGEGEQARLMKLVVNLMIAQTTAMLAEALALGRRGGLRWEDLWSVIGASAVASPIVKAKGVQLSQRDFTPTFTVEQMVKDLGLIVDAAAAAHVPVPQTAATLQLMHSAIAQGEGGEDYAAIIKCVERATGLGELT
ncbi:MAG TPA: NAD(P)-dependent oxidoreductase [Ramlibacter sp.]|nr:NAD(P)-dependent oxidoreductase [Ramlibacter sp.]